MAVDLYQMAAKVREQRNGKEIRAEGYSGKRKFLVQLGQRIPLTVYAANIADAIWTAAKVWGVDPRKADVHQGCRVTRC